MLLRYMPLQRLNIFCKNIVLLLLLSFNISLNTVDQTLIFNVFKLGIKQVFI